MSDPTESGLSPQQENQLLAGLKGQESDLGRLEGAPIEHGGPAAEAQGAFGKAAAAIAHERGVPVGAVAASVPADPNYDPAQLTAMLDAAAVHAQRVETQEEGFIDRSRGVANKLQAARDKQHNVNQQMAAVEDAATTVMMAAEMEAVMEAAMEAAAAAGMQPGAGNVVITPSGAQQGGIPTMTSTYVSTTYVTTTDEPMMGGTQQGGTQPGGAAGGRTERE